FGRSAKLPTRNDYIWIFKGRVALGLSQNVGTDIVGFTAWCDTASPPAGDCGKLSTKIKARTAPPVLQQSFIRFCINNAVENSILNQFRLDGQAALVVGGNRGLGLEIAKA